MCKGINRNGQMGSHANEQRGTLLSSKPFECFICKSWSDVRGASFFLQITGLASPRAGKDTLVEGGDPLKSPLVTGLHAVVLAFNLQRDPLLLVLLLRPRERWEGR
jgi:hypothetical protein